MTFTYPVDDIALEIDETVTLRVTSPTLPSSPLNAQLGINAFFMNTAELVILDSDSEYKN